MLISTSAILDSNILGYDDRPWASIEAMNAGLIERWNSVVGDDDEVWFLGDACMGKISETLPLCAELKGHKTLISGNHDRCWSGHGEKHKEWIQAYHNVGFEQILNPTVTNLHVNVQLGKHKVIACHFPYRGDHGSGKDRYSPWRPDDTGKWLLHGHVHTEWTQRGRMINIGAPVHNYTPISDEQLIEMIDRGVRDE